jgi:hypothetical protein
VVSLILLDLLKGSVVGIALGSESLLNIGTYERSQEISRIQLTSLHTERGGGPPLACFSWRRSGGYTRGANSISLRTIWILRGRGSWLTVIGLQEDGDGAVSSYGVDDGSKLNYTSAERNIYDDRVENWRTYHAVRPLSAAREAMSKFLTI